MLSITPERRHDAAAIELLLDQAFGPAWRLKPSSRYRTGAPPLPGLDLVARDGDRVVGTIRYGRVRIGEDVAALLLGPLAVAADRRGNGIGTALMWQSLDHAAWANHRIILLVGDPGFYGRYGFSAAVERQIFMVGAESPLLVKGLGRDALDGAGGPVGSWRCLRSDRRAA